MSLLATRGLTKHFGGLAAVQGLDLDIDSGQMVGLIGPNGAGKTTVFNMISGFLSPSKGQILFKGMDITGLQPSRIAEKGLVRTFQLTTLFMDLTVLQNVLIGCHRQARIGLWQDLFRTTSVLKRERAVEGKALAALEFTGLSEFKNELAGNMPHGRQRSLSLAIALATEPEMLLLDEPVTGMNANETTAFMGRLESLKEKGITILLIEHNMLAAMSYCDRMIVLNYGQKIADGTPVEIRHNEDVIKAYLGSEEGY
jgi:branched-chain amino acid transport system ATP-binding protein